MLVEGSPSSSRIWEIVGGSAPRLMAMSVEDARPACFTFPFSSSSSLVLRSTAVANRGWAGRCPVRQLMLSTQQACRGGD